MNRELAHYTTDRASLLSLDKRVLWHLVIERGGWPPFPQHPSKKANKDGLVLWLMSHVPPACPVCGKAAVYSRKLDQFFHEDGTENDSCWVRLHRGQETASAPAR